MKALGIVRKVDELGRIVIPKELRATYDIDSGTPLEIFVDEDFIMLKVYNPACIFCGSAKGVHEVKGKMICENCLKELKTMR